MPTSKKRVICLDIEGGYGGSSRSLFYLLKNIDRERFDLEVICRKDGPIVAKYQSIGIPVRVVDDLPKVSALPRNSRNLFVHANFLRDWLRSRKSRMALVEVIRNDCDLVHFNHEGFWFLGKWLRSRVPAAFVFHNRTLLWNTIFARFQARTIASISNKSVFITERELENMRILSGDASGAIINNVVEVSRSPKKYSSTSVNKLDVICLANYSWARGIDRLIDIAVALKQRGQKGVHFHVAGKHQLSGNLPGQLGILARQGKTLADYAAFCGVPDMFTFLGHVVDPEELLGRGDILIKPSREDNPWGRDILEAMSTGLPVIACGTYDRFVENGVTGYLLQNDERFDAAKVAEVLSLLSLDRSEIERLGTNAQKRVEQFCDGPSQASLLMKVWDEAIDACARECRNGGRT